jgi:N4-gp56 family major capsid protein
MAVLVTNSITDISEEVNYQMMRGLLSAARKRLPFFNGTLPGELMGSGSTRSVKWERIENLDPVITPLAEPLGSTAWQNARTLVQPTKSTKEATAAKYGNAIQLTEEVDLLQVNVKAARLLDTLGANAGESLNELMIDEYQTVTSTSVRNGSTVAAGAGVPATTITSIISAISAGDVKWAVNRVNRNSGMRFTPLGTGSQNYNSQPIRDAYYGVCHSDVEEDIRLLTSFIGVEQYAGYTQTIPGEFGTANGVRFASTELSGIIEIDSGGSSNALRSTGGVTAIDLYDTFIYGKEAVGTISLNAEHTTDSYKMYDTVPSPIQLISHAPGSAGAGDPYNEIATIAWKAWWAAEILNVKWLTRIRTGAMSLGG